MESTRRDLSNDMAEHRPILKNNQNKHHPHPRFGLTPKTGTANEVFFLLWEYKCVDFDGHRSRHFTEISDGMINGCKRKSLAERSPQMAAAPPSKNLIVSPSGGELD